METIGSFAESLILQDIQEVKEGKILPPALRDSAPTPDSRDIRNVEVPQSFMQQVLGESHTPAVEVTPTPEKEEDPTPPSPSKSMDQLIEEFSEVVGQAKEILNEMTAVGSLGVAGLGTKTADPFKKKTKKKSSDALTLLRKKIKKNGRKGTKASKKKT